MIEPKMKLNFNLIAVLAVIGIIILSCTKKPVNCTDSICTQEFKTYSININSNLLDNITLRVIDVNDGSIIRTLNDVDAGTKNTFTIFTDADMPFINGVNTPEQFKVEFLKGTTLLQTEIYNFTKDCCHFTKTSGADEVTIL